ncbi:hypothetical protein AQUCO_01400550v1 [Aquilegia coerulea]|uniref:Uncharacterized protein n=1 Tax=Aquilegia coerulea TaxID=218851 RepID=A0A2G5DWZ3_AQUCA|nr:hypothetical protein AQUCO_01400550v1 [Aquilegia coerulea]
MGETKRPSPLPAPEKLIPKSIDEHNTHRFSTSDEVTHDTTEFPTSAQGEQNTIRAQQNFINSQKVHRR